MCIYNQGEHGSDDEEEEEEIVTIPAEKSKVASLEKMIALVATLVEKSRDENNSLRLSTNDWNALTGGGKVGKVHFLLRWMTSRSSVTNCVRFSM